MSSIAQSLEKIRNRVTVLERRYERAPEDVRVLAVSKTMPPDAVLAALEIGQRDFGENHVQDALAKLDTLAHLDLIWHFIGHLQSNKTRDVAENFAWVHTIERLKIAERLSSQRPQDKPDLNICIQINIDNEESKSGVSADDALGLARAISQLPKLRLRFCQTIIHYNHIFTIVISFQIR